MTDLSLERVSFFRSAIAGFIQQSKEDKLNGKPDDDGKYEYESWLGSAAKRVSQLNGVTHTPKATHSDAKGTGILINPNQNQFGEIGTHSLQNGYQLDVMGNAAALDVFKFLKVEVEGKTLLHWASVKDEAFAKALSDIDEVASERIAAFAGLTDLKEGFKSHTLAKQVYFLVGEEPTKDTDFHLLQTLHASSLEHEVYQNIQHVRFSDESVEARKAKREGKPSQLVYSEYKNLAVRKLGGTKPLNISQLNSERLGRNHLFSSLPPKWSQSNKINVLNTDSVFKQFIWFDEVRWLVKELADFLKTDPEPNDATRQKRAGFEQALAEQLLAFGETIRGSFDIGWSQESRCQLPLEERVWLDSERIEITQTDEVNDQDQAFQSMLEQNSWQEKIATRHANWLNDQLRRHDLKLLGEAEHKHWAKEVLKDISRGR